MNDYGCFSKRFVDKIKLCIANIMGTFLQSSGLLLVFSPFRRMSSLLFMLREGKYGTNLVILLIKDALGELNIGHKKTK